MKSFLKTTSCLLIIYSMLLVSDVSAVVAIKAIVFFVVQTATGYVASRIFLRKSDIQPSSEVANVAIGFVLGSIIFVLIDQFFIKYKFDARLEPVIVIAIFLCCVTWTARAALHKKNNPANENISFTALLLVMTLSLCVLLSSWFWLIPATPFLVLGAILVHRSRTWAEKNRILGMLSISIGVVQLFLQLHKRPEFWSIHHLHYQFDEALNISLSRFGVFENMTAIGEPLNYHWFSHAWIGMVSQTIGAGDWVVSTRIMPIIVALVIVCFAFEIGRKLTESTSGGLIVASVFVMSPVFHVISPRVSWVMTTSHSQLFGMIFVLGFLYLFIESYLNCDIGVSVLLSIFLAALTITKVNHAVILVAGLTITCITNLIKSHDGQLRKIVRYLTIVTPTFFAYMFSQSFGSTSGARVGVLPLAAQMSGDFKGIISLRREVIALYFVCGVFGLVILAIAVLLQNRFSFNENFVVLTISVATVGLLIALLFDFGVDGRQIYFWHSASMLVWLSTGLVFHEVFINRRQNYSLSHIVAMCVASIGVFILLNTLPNLNSGSDMAAILRSTSSNAAVIFPAFVAIFYVFKCWSRNRPSEFVAGKIPDYLIFSIVASAFAFFLVTHFQRFNDDYKSVGDESANIVVPRDLELVGKWFQDNTPADAIVATNSFCEFGNCSEKNLKIFSTTGDPEYRLSGSSTDYRMAIAIKRRFLMTSFSFLTTDGKLTNWAVERIRLSRDFSAEPSSELLSKLEEHGVRYFVNDSEVNRGTGLTQFGAMTFKAGRYVVIDLAAN